EAGVLDIPPEDVVRKGRLQPGRLFLVDTAQRRIVADDELKDRYAREAPYGEGLRKSMLQMESLPRPHGPARCSTTSSSSSRRSPTRPSTPSAKRSSWPLTPPSGRRRTCSSPGRNPAGSWRCPPPSSPTTSWRGSARWTAARRAAC